MNKVTSLLALFVLLLPVAQTFALPDDRNQPVNIVADSSEILFDQGLFIYRGNPARISQGSLEISGTEIRIERTEGVIRGITAIGSPARFQQQPAIDQGIVYASGGTIAFDNDEQIMTIDGNAELNQEGVVTTAQHIEYDLEENTGRIDSGDDDQIRVILPPPENGL